MRLLLVLLLLLCLSQSFAQTSGGESVQTPADACFSSGDLSEQICLERYSANRLYDAETSTGAFQAFLTDSGPVVAVIAAGVLGFMVSRVRFH